MVKSGTYWNNSINIHYTVVTTTQGLNGRKAWSLKEIFGFRLYYSTIGQNNFGNKICTIKY